MHPSLVLPYPLAINFAPGAPGSVRFCPELASLFVCVPVVDCELSSVAACMGECVMTGSMKVSTRCRLSLNHGPFLRSLSLSSMLVIVLFVLALCLSSSTTIFLIAEGESSHPGVHANLVLSEPASILAWISSIMFGCGPYSFRSMSFPYKKCHIWSPVTLMISGSHLIAARRSSSRCSISSMLLIAVASISLPRLPFSLYISIYILIYAGTLVAQRALLICKAMSAAAPRFSSSLPTTWGKMI